MAGLIKVNTAQVADIATRLADLNTKLNEELKLSQDTIKKLSNIWDGEAYDATLAGYEEFATKYFQTYYDAINGYVDFLRMNVDQGYFETETNNTNLAEQFK